MRYKIEDLKDINDTKSFLNAYQSSCSFKILKYSMYLIVIILLTLVIWSNLATKDIVVHAYGVIDTKNDICNIYIENTCIGNIKEDKEVRIEIISLPKNEYGVITSKINKMSDDVVVDNNSGRKYYVASCLLEKDYLTDKSGEKVSLKNNMEAKVTILRYKTTYFRYILDKIY